ncbi:MAG: hypothetical protein IKU84_00360 [Clostridia bacterium]|nr:hypothetical protein [Clostridia bacterium]
MKKRISILLCVAMLLAFLAGCGEDNLTGTWEATINVSETIGAGIMDEMAKSMPEAKDYVDLGELTLVVRTTFNEDGTFVSAVTEESFAAMMDSAADKACDGFTAYINKIITDLKLNIDANTVIGLNEGETLADRFKAQFKTEDFKKILEENSQSGVYVAKGGKLFTADVEENINEEKYEVYTLSGDTLEVTEAVGMDEDVVSVMIKAYPMTYKKIG